MNSFTAFCIRRTSAPSAPCLECGRTRSELSCPGVQPVVGAHASNTFARPTPQLGLTSNSATPSIQGMRFVTFRCVVLLALAASARGQTGSPPPDDAFAIEGVCSHDPDVDVAGLSGPQPSRLWANSPPAEPHSCYPDLSGLRSLGTYSTVATGARLAYTQTGAYAQTRAARPAHAQASSSSCAQPCRPAYPYQQVPIDADGILARCDSGLAGAVVGILHSLSINR